MTTTVMTRVWAVLLLLLPAYGAHAQLETEGFCGWAQQVIAQTGLSAQVVTHNDYDSFVESKPNSLPLQVQQYLSNPVPGNEGMARVISCKMKTAERINSARPGPPPAAGDLSCATLHREMLAAMLERIPAPEPGAGATQPAVLEEDMTYIGPRWLRPWPFNPLSRDESGQLQLHTRALYVPFAWWVPMPDRFKGSYYCHLVAPEFLHAVLRGEVDPGERTGNQQ
jgi:hypothetical protein